ncbi:MAG: hypothetical protein ACI9EW_003142 [Cellvibrionaceae bacterium]|jgi:hypothetical protein
MTEPSLPKSNPQNNKLIEPSKSSWNGFIQASGVILAVSYPVLALSTGFRAVFRLFFKEGVTDYWPPAMSLIAALSYLIATFGIVYREKWGKNAWRLSVGVLGFETLCTLIVGTLSFIEPDLIGNTVWRHFGADYGYFPLFQPLLGLAWLFNKDVRRSYGFPV